MSEDGFSPKGEKVGVDLVEVMARAAYEEWIAAVKGIERRWQDLDESFRDRMILSQRAALLALAEAELPDELLDDCYLLWTNSPPYRQERHNFAAILRAIARGTTPASSADEAEPFREAKP